MRVSRYMCAGLLTLTSTIPAFSQTPARVPAASAATAVPPLLNYPGTARSADGKPLAGEVTMTFLIYKDEEGGQPLWVESQSVATDNTGRYQVQLGATGMSGIPLNLFNSGEARWIEVQIAGEKPLPRALLVSVPYALKAADAETLGGLPAAAFLHANGPAGAVNTGGVEPLAGSVVTATGASSGYLPRFTGASTVVSSEIFDTGTRVGIGITAPTATLDVNGTALVTGALSAKAGASFGGPVLITNSSNATTTAGVGSHSLGFAASAFNTSSNAPVAQTFQIVAYPVSNNTTAASGQLRVLFGQGTATPAATGLSIASNGQITFAAGQKFPGGSGTITGVTAGTALTGGGTTGTVALNLDTSKVPLLAANNNFNGSQSVSGNVSATGSLSANGQLISRVGNGTPPLAVSSTTQVTNLNASYLGGAPSSAFASVSGSNNFAGIQSFSSVGVGTTTPRSRIEIVATAKGAVGPVITLTNPGGLKNAAGALDFNTTTPTASGYNPMARITATDNLKYSDNIAFQSNTPGAINNGLQTNVFIQSDGQTGINTIAPIAQLEVDSNPNLGTDALYAFGSTNNAGAGTVSIEGFGGGSLSNNPGGVGGYFQGGYAEGTGTGGDGIDAFAGGTAGQGSASGYAGSFSGDVIVTGTLTAGAKHFEIDHPLDPGNKFLDHASIESSEMVNIYSGNVTTDELGRATVHLPDWFEAVNGDFRYQLTVIGKFAQAIVSKEISSHEFTISTNASFTKVSWQVTGVRHDAFSKAHPLVVERDKLASERGFYAHPELYGQSPEKQIQWARHPQMMKSVVAARNARKRLETRASR